MNEDIGRRFAAAEMQARWEEQGVEGHNVFANEMVLLNCRVSHIGIVVFTALFQQVFERRQITNGRIQPHIKVFTGCIGNFNAKVGRIARNVPVAQAFRSAAVRVGAHAEPLFNLVGHFRLQLAILRPFF